MTVTAERFEDVSEPGDPHPFAYRGTVYRFSEDGRTLTARAYNDTPGQLSFLSWDDGRRIRRVPRPRLLRRAVAYARTALGATDVRLLTRRGYVPLGR
ncbi:hypothetical protein [Rubrivirga sp.]|uniref:hypothetical protein n=1 Tax=Rubrivirga sp. TaxID=1885344 RepID=UPI003B52E3B5